MRLEESKNTHVKNYVSNTGLDAVLKQPHRQNNNEYPIIYLHLIIN